MLALATSLRNSGVTTLSVPIGSLIILLVLSARLGLAAASWRARRARRSRRVAKFDVLQEIATQ
ncbi:MAG: hypothetical protein ACRDKD_10855 [Solirubrobacteraceae bacterium]